MYQFLLRLYSNILIFLLKEYAALCEEQGVFPLKDWNFPKSHSYKHIFEDIRAKGVTRNYNTKPNEKMHGIIKMIYKLLTNFKEIAPQACYVHF